jgi:hypothetical protein
MESAMRAMLIGLLVFGLCGCGGKALPDAATVKKNLTVSQFEPGQIWTYPTRENEESSRLTILKVEHDENFGTVVHIHVSNLSIPNASAPSGKTTEIRHMPFADESLAASVTALESTTDQIPDFQEGYDQWRSAVNDGQGGIFTIDVVDGVTFIADAIAQQ